MALLISMSGVGMVLWYDTKFEKGMEPWMGLYTVLCIFLYQTLDAVDGKQARRTKTSSPLGQLFDHGCDGINTLFFFIQMWQSFGQGANWGFISIYISATF